MGNRERLIFLKKRMHGYKLIFASVPSRRKLNLGQIRRRTRFSFVVLYSSAAQIGSIVGDTVCGGRRQGKYTALSLIRPQKNYGRNRSDCLLLGRIK